MDVFRWNRGPKPKHHLSDKERDLAARPRGRKAEKEYPLDPKADNHTKGNKIPSATKSTTALDVSGLTRYYAPLPAPDYHGPNFEKGPLQAEIRQESGMMSIWNSDTNIQNVPYRPKFRGRAHSVHGPIFHHHLQCPYEILPEKCTPQIYAEYREYKRLSDAERVHKKAVGEVNGGLSKLTADDREKAIIDGISHAKAAENQEKFTVQARLGFAQKYPQCYVGNGIGSHKKDIRNREKGIKRLAERRKELCDALYRWILAD